MSSEITDSALEHSVGCLDEPAVGFPTRPEAGRVGALDHLRHESLTGRRAAPPPACPSVRSALQQASLLLLDIFGFSSTFSGSSIAKSR